MSALCELCGKPMPEGETMFKYHGYSGPCPAAAIPRAMKLFRLLRLEDVSGVSGTGVVAEGVQFTNGKCALSWLTKHTSVAIYDDVATLVTIHEHGGRTKLVWDEAAS